jgi:hypothetical protein
VRTSHPLQARRASTDRPESLFPAPALLNYSNKISQGAFGGAAGFTVNNGLKGEPFKPVPAAQAHD